MAFGKQRSVNPARFAMVPRPSLPRSVFDLSHTHKTTFNAGFLVPVYVDEVLPGDSFRVRMTAFCRLATATVPIMDNLILESFFFFVPNRLVWSNWQRFMGEQVNPSDTTEFLVPTVPIGGVVVGDVADYFGISFQAAAGSAPFSVNALPFRAYNLIWNDWFRDEDLSDLAVVALGDGPDVLADYGLRSRGKRHDYFTSARPWPQKPQNNPNSGLLMGDLVPGQRMRLPQSGAPVSGIGQWAGSAVTPGAGPISARETGSRTIDYPEYFNTESVNSILIRADAVSNFPDIRVLVNDIRTANMVQLLLERNARGGTRYTEIVRAHFGVISPDARLNRPEYLGGGRANITINPIGQTSATGIAGTTTPLGELAGVGTALASNNGFSSSFTEHGFIIGLVSVRADLTYQNGTARMWFRRTLWDHYWPDLANLGEQSIQGREIWTNGDAGDLTVFGYQERWSEYKYKPSRVSGQFKSNAVGGTLDMWHLAQNFATRPVLNQAFILEDPPVDRVLETDTTFGTQFLFDSVFDIRKATAMPMFSIPGLGPRL